jgi:hypothetical protein
MSPSDKNTAEASMIGLTPVRRRIQGTEAKTGEGVAAPIRTGRQIFRMPIPTHNAYRPQPRSHTPRSYTKRTNRGTLEGIG